MFTGLELNRKFGLSKVLKSLRNANLGKHNFNREQRNQLATFLCIKSIIAKTLKKAL
jgi:hypothetical protein